VTHTKHIKTANSKSPHADGDKKLSFSKTARRYSVSFENALSHTSTPELNRYHAKHALTGCG